MSTFLTRSLHATALALAGAVLLAPASGLAQRRVITGRPATEEKKEEPKPAETAPAAPEPAKEDPKKEEAKKAEEPAKKEEPKKAEEAKKEAAKKPEEPAKKEEPKKAEEAKKPEEARKPIAAQPEPASPNATPPAASKDEPRRALTGDEPKKETPPEKPVILVPKDEQGASGSGAKASAAPKADEALYRKKIDKMSVTLRVRPAKPVPGKTTTLVFEVVKHLAVPDPALGDRVPLEKAILFADVGKDGGAMVRYRLHPLSDAGVYGIHLTAAEAGPYRIALEQRLENAEIGDKALTADFVLGIGQDTPMQAAEEESATKSGRGRTALRAGDAPPAEGAPTVMKALGDGWMELAAGLAKPNSGTDLVAIARTMAEAAEKLVGQAPAAFGSQRRDFDALANEAAAALKELVPLVGTDAAKAREAMTRIEVANCAKCHVKYRFQLTDDVASWPKFTPKAPKDAPAQQSGPRKPVK
ncbi:MAG: hypothetical protein QM765_15365 [Myxococcales bacterium]